MLAKRPYGFLVPSGVAAENPPAAKILTLDIIDFIAIVKRTCQMAQLIVRGLDDHVKQRLRTQAAPNNRSLEAEVRLILTRASEESASDPIAAILEAVAGHEAEPNLPEPTYEHRGASFA